MVSKGKCGIMDDCGHGNIQWKYTMEIIRECCGDELQLLLQTQDCFPIQYTLEPTRGGNVLDLILSPQNELVDNVKVYKPWGSSDHNQIHFSTKVKTGNAYKKTEEELRQRQRGY